MYVLSENMRTTTMAAKICLTARAIFCAASSSSTFNLLYQEIDLSTTDELSL